jgi:uncharacterized protein (DUF983 family)
MFQKFLQIQREPMSCCDVIPDHNKGGCGVRNVFYIIGVVVVVAIVLSYLGII